MSYATDDTGHRGLSDQDIAAERETCAAVDRAFSHLCAVLILARGKSTLRREQLDEAFAALDDIRPDPVAWNEDIEAARS